MKKVFKALIATLMAAFLLVCATGCVAKDWTKAKANLEEEGYAVTSSANELAIAASIALHGLTADASEIECYISATKDGASAFFIYCEEGDVAGDLYKQIKADKADLMKAYNLNDDTCKMGKSGKVVFFGHKDVVKVA